MCDENFSWIWWMFSKLLGTDLNITSPAEFELILFWFRNFCGNQKWTLSSCVFWLFFNGHIFATSCDEKNKKNTQYDYFHKSKVLVRLAPIKNQTYYATPKNDTEQQTLTLSQFTGSDISHTREECKFALEITKVFLRTRF